ncbi:MAG: hypothetical protein LBE12_15040, partial [Planctomycetaceae bacterium]|nr:hypothetical protein [Planctomycetaceae bacterium]
IGLCNTENEITVTPTTHSIALFKNGVTVVQQEIAVPAPGLYCWNEVPKVIHGTFFIESDLNIETRTAQRLVTLPVDVKNPLQNIADLAGKNITVCFADKSVVQGKLISNSKPRESNSLFTDNSRLRSDYYVYSNVYSAPTSAPFNLPFQLETSDKKYVFLTGQQIFSIETDEPVTEHSEYRPVMFFQVNAKNGKTAGTIRLFYLTKGTTWAPSYRIDLLNDKRVSVEQSALIRNEWSPFHDTEISLVSGFPQIESSQILSPLHPSQTLQQFFQQILSQSVNRNRGYGNNDPLFMSNAMTQQAIHPNSIANTGFDTTALAVGEGPDIHYNNIGKKTLETGDTLSLSTGKGETDYQRILECDLVPIIQNYHNNNNNHPAVGGLLVPETNIIHSEVFQKLTKNVEVILNNDFSPLKDKLKIL